MFVLLRAKVASGSPFRVSLEAGLVRRVVVPRERDARSRRVRRPEICRDGGPAGRKYIPVILRHILPNVLPIVLVYAATVLGGAILAEVGLSFRGGGVPPPRPSWGQDISGMGRTLMISAPWLVLFPSLALCITVLSVNLLADGLRDHLDPRLRGQWGIGRRG